MLPRASGSPSVVSIPGGRQIQANGDGSRFRATGHEWGTASPKGWAPPHEHKPVVVWLVECPEVMLCVVAEIFLCVR